MSLPAYCKYIKGLLNQKPSRIRIATFGHSFISHQDGSIDMMLGTFRLAMSTCKDVRLLYGLPRNREIDEVLDRFDMLGLLTPSLKITFSDESHAKGWLFSFKSQNQTPLFPGVIGSRNLSSSGWLEFFTGVPATTVKYLSSIFDAHWRNNAPISWNGSSKKKRH